MAKREIETTKEVTICDLCGEEITFRNATMDIRNGSLYRGKLEWVIATFRGASYYDNRHYDLHSECVIDLVDKTVKAKSD